MQMCFSFNSDIKNIVVKMGKLTKIVMKQQTGLLQCLHHLHQYECGTFQILQIRPSLKKSFVCCYPTHSFESGSVGRYFFFFLQTGWNGRDFKYELEGITFIPVHFPFSSSFIY